MEKASVILGVVGIILLLISGTARADMIADSTHPVQFIFSGYNLNYTTNLSNATETTTATYLNLSINSSYIWFNMTVPSDLTLSNLTYASDIWNFTGMATAGTMTIMANVSNATGSYDLKVDSVVTSTQSASGNHVIFTYAGWSTHSFTIESSGVGGMPASTFIPPVPVWVSNTTGLYWVNHTWTNGTGNITNSYNVTVNGTWYNGTAVFFNSTLSPSGCSNITIWAYNNTGVMSLTNISNNSCAPASPTYAPVISSYSPADLTPSYVVGALATFEAGANQSVTWTWTEATEGAGDGTPNSTATKTWLSAGAKTVTVTCSNVNGSCGTIQWDVTVTNVPSSGYILSGYLSYPNASPVPGARARVKNKAEYITGADGYYEFTGLVADNYTALFEKDYYHDGVGRIVLTDNTTYNYTFISRMHTSTPGFSGIMAVLGIIVIFITARYRKP